MGYHGRYYRVAAGDPGFFSGLTKIAGMIPGVGPAISGAMSIGKNILTKPMPKGVTNAPKAATMGVGAAVGTAGAALLTGLGIGGVGATVMGMMGKKHPAAGYRRRRRMNPANGKALRRAIRRVESGAKVFRACFSMSHGKSIHGAPGVKMKRARRRG